MRCRFPTRLSARRLLAAMAAAAVALMPLSPAGAADPAPEKDPIRAAATDAYWRGDFTALERQYIELQHGSPFLEDGASKLEMFRIGLSRVTGAYVKQPESYLLELEALSLQWTREHPASPLAHILYVQVLDAHAWSYRGGGFANTVTPEAWKQFRAYLHRAVDYLKTHGDVALTDSSAYVALLNIGRGLGWDARELQAISEAGLQRNPHDLNLYFDTMTAFLPKWGGTPQGLDAYIRSVAERTKSDYGMGMYARMYSAAAQEEFSHGLFVDSLADWGTMKRSYEDMLARYPNSPTRRNRYAYMACMAKDRSTLRTLLAELGPKVDATEWGENPERTLEGCRRWAEER